VSVSQATNRDFRCAFDESTWVAILTLVSGN